MEKEGCYGGWGVKVVLGVGREGDFFGREMNEGRRGEGCDGDGER